MPKGAINSINKMYSITKARGFINQQNKLYGNFNLKNKLTQIINTTKNKSKSQS